MHTVPDEWPDDLRRVALGEALRQAQVHRRKLTDAAEIAAMDREIRELVCRFAADVDAQDNLNDL